MSCVYSWSRYLRMSARTSEMFTLGCHLFTGFPSGPTRNFSKFHLMSLIFRGSQNSLPVGLPRLSPTGGQEFCVAESTGDPTLICNTSVHHLQRLINQNKAINSHLYIWKMYTGIGCVCASVQSVTYQVSVMK